MPGSGVMVLLSVMLSSGAQLRLVWSDAERAFPWDPSEVFREAQGIFERIGVEMAWDEDLERPVPARVLSILVILRPADSSRFGLPELTMGAVLGNQPHRAVFIFFPNVIRTLGFEQDTGAPRGPRARRLISLAVARVIAHEVVHAVLPEREHDSNGLLSLQLGRKQLVSSRLPLAESTALALIDRLETFGCRPGSC